MHEKLLQCITLSSSWKSLTYIFILQNFNLPPVTNVNTFNSSNSTAYLSTGLFHFHHLYCHNCRPGKFSKRQARKFPTKCRKNDGLAICQSIIFFFIIYIAQVWCSIILNHLKALYNYKDKKVVHYDQSFYFKKDNFRIAEDYNWLQHFVMSLLMNIIKTDIVFSSNTFNINYNGVVIINNISK